MAAAGKPNAQTSSINKDPRNNKDRKIGEKEETGATARITKKIPAVEVKEGINDIVDVEGVCPIEKGEAEEGPQPRIVDDLEPLDPGNGCSAQRSLGAARFRNFKTQFGEGA
jgi:hypothetical protein